MYYRKIHRVHSKSMFVVKKWEGSLKTKLKRTGRGRGGGQFTKASVHWGRGGIHLKQTETNKGRGGPKTGSFEQTYFLNDLTPLINGWFLIFTSNIWWNTIKVGWNLPVKNNLILASSVILVKRYVNLQRFFQ